MDQKRVTELSSVNTSSLPELALPEVKSQIEQIEDSFIPTV